MSDELCRCMVKVDETGIVSIWSMCMRCVAREAAQAMARPGVRITRLDDSGNVVTEGS